MTIEPFHAPSGNLSAAWAQVFLRLLDRGIKDLSPVVVTVDDFDDAGPVELSPVRDRLAEELARQGTRSIATVANTIFPNSLWQPGVPNNDTLLYERYERIWPLIARDRVNRHGVYFRRLTSFRPSTHPNDEPVNQLARMIDIYRRSSRRSALQACIFDPTADHRDGPFLSFPCLQQIAFSPLEGGGLGMTAFYAMQYQFEKAYGNYLGLCRLGRFVASQLGRRLTHMTCTACIVKLADAPKSDFAALGADLRSALANLEEERRTA